MPACINHPERETNFVCMKHNLPMCEECLECKDPNLYCKYRSACPIWFFHKEKEREQRQQEAGTEQEYANYTVTFQPDQKQVQVPAGTTLLEAAQNAGVKINASCNGSGTCGKCKLIIQDGNIKTEPTPLLSDSEKEKGYVLACQTTVHGVVQARLPEETIEKRLRCSGMGEKATAALQGCLLEHTPMLSEVHLELPPPSMEDQVSDLDRLNRGLKKQGFEPERMNVSLEVIRQLAANLREENWKVTASLIRKKCSNEILKVYPGHNGSKNLGLAIDLGTTTIMVYLVDMQDGRVLAAQGGHNKQSACGDDVINRIVCAEKRGVEKLSKMALNTINGLINDVLDTAGEQEESINNVVVSGNTTMTHLFLGIEPRYIRRKPFIPTVSDFPVLKSREIGLNTDPAAAVFVVPGPASYVGGDIIAGVLYTEIHKKEEMTLFVDVGTNGEIVLGNKDFLVSASCSAGPAFEGGGIRWGMRAEEGSIENVEIEAGSLEPKLSIIGEKSPRGICGTGMIGLLSEMLNKGVIDQQGKYILDSDHPRIKQMEDEKAYVLEFAENTQMNEDIVFLETDINTLLYSKGAIFAGFKVLLDQVGLSFDVLDKILIAGGFGEYLNIDQAVNIGLLPDIDRNKFQFVGNSAIAGSYLCLLSEEHRQQARSICNSMTYIDFSDNNSFMDEFTSALFLPHTNVNLFPSVMAVN
ncbi:MAG: ASKHA domain-containing protein [Thermodesulfobacteriota bacterium]